MVRNHFEIIAGGADALALEVSRKPRTPEEGVSSSTRMKIENIMVPGIFLKCPECHTGLSSQPM